MQTIVNLGTGGADLNGQNGSTTSADSNDALFLDWPGDNAGNYIYLPGAAGNYLSVPDEAALDITGDIDIRVKVALDDWTPSTNQVLISKLQTVGQFSWYLYLDTTGKPVFSHYSDGSSGKAQTSTAALGATDGQDVWLRVTLDVDNGASGYDVKFYSSTDGVTWNQLGTTRTGSGTSSIFAGSSEVEIGAYLNGAAATITTAKVYRAQVLNGIGGTTVLDVDCSQITSGADTSFTAATGQTVTINRSTSGRKSVAVVTPVWLFGTDDRFSVSTNDLISKFDSDEALTVLAVFRQWDTVPASYMLSTRAGTANAGYGLNFTTAGNYTPAFFADSGPVLSARGLLSTSQSVVSVVAGVLDLDSSGQSQYGYTNGNKSLVSNLSGFSIDSDSVFYVGSFSSASQFTDMELLAVAVFRRALTASEITALTTYYQNKVA